MVQRFNAELERDGGLGLPCLTMRSNNIGEWVSYEDYAELERKLFNFADQVLYAPCSKVTEEMACEILGI